MNGNKITIGTRGSELALWQANYVRSQLEASGFTAEIMPVTTSGDKITDRPLYDIGGKGLFVKELDEMLLMSKVDIAVHSLKDVPGIIENGITLAAVMPRENPADSFLSVKYNSFEELPEGAKIGTSSARRAAQVLAIRQDINIVPTRGNVPTRISKMEGGESDAIILAAAGLKRLGLTQHIKHEMRFEIMLPAIAQGIIGITARIDDSETIKALSQINSPLDFTAATAERAIMRPINASCNTPLAAHASINGKNLHLTALLASRDGKRIIRAERFGFVDEAEELGLEIGHEFKISGSDLI